ncbi:MAG: TonB-dependent receptor [Porticoccaceae bacterium]|nr:TonB-dependent receptor [Porticoccaceae bacterium]MEA3301534.1 TonB-dependent receptor [Pseudomonadota bacterium]
MHSARLRTGFACSLLWLASQAQANPAASPVESLSMEALVDTLSLEDLANMVVTDTKVAQSRDTVTQNIVVLPGDGLDRQPTPNRNIAELLRHVSGQFVNVLSRNDANWGSYAGLGPKYNSYLLDGLPIDSFVDPMSLDPWAFERIEAHKGPASVLYSNYLTMDFAGNEAPLAGTTNLILRERVDQTLTRLQASHGTEDTSALRAYHQGRQGNLSYFVGASGERADYRMYGVPDSWLQTVEDPDYRKTKFYAKVSHAFGRDDHRLSLFAHHTRHDGDMGRPNRDFRHRYDLLNLVYNNALSAAWHLQFKAGERRYERQFDNDNYPASLDLLSVSRTPQRIRPLDLTLSYRHWGDALLTVGVDHQRVDYRTETRVDGVLNRENRVEGSSRGLYLQEKVQLGDWVLRAGVRRNTLRHQYALLGGQTPDATRAEWSDNLWSIGARYNLSPTLALYANAGSSFMAPAAKQIGGTIANPLTDSGQIANPGLGAESGTGKDVGVEWRPTDTLTLGARAFHNRVSSAIVDNVVNANPSQALASNAGELTATGIEVDIAQDAGQWFSWFANATVSDTETEDPANPDQDGTRIPFVPDQVANLGLSARLPGDIQLHAYYHWVGRYYDSTSRASRIPLGNHGVLNARLEKALAIAAPQSLTLFLDIGNLTDRRHELPFGFRETGFTAVAGVDVRF